LVRKFSRTSAAGWPLPNLAPFWNVALTNDCTVVRRHPEIGAGHIDVLKWGLLRPAAGE
jgi:hypothetical protein